MKISVAVVSGLALAKVAMAQITIIQPGEIIGMCKFDAQSSNVTVGDYVGVSSLTEGDCYDQGLRRDYSTIGTVALPIDKDKHEAAIKALDKNGN